MPTNNFESNITRQLARVFMEKFESARIMSKGVDTQLLEGRFGPSSGDKVDFKRPTDYKSFRNPTGNATGKSQAIITGKATGIVQDYFFELIDWEEAEEAIEMDQLDELLAPAATRIVTDLELDFAGFMMRNAALLAGVPGTPVTAWNHVSNASAVMKSHGIPMDGDWMYALNPFTQDSLADFQQALQAGGKAGDLIDSAFKQATISEKFAGMRVLTATTLDSYNLPADLVGAVDGVPNVTYLAAKDSMTQVVTIDGLTNGQVIPAGAVVRIAGLNRLNLSTRRPVIDATGAKIVWTATVTESVTVASGEATLVLTGPAVFESDGAYNTADAAILDDAVATILGTLSTTVQPNLFWHKKAFSIGSVPIKKLFSTDTLATTEDGLRIRVSKFADGITNEQFIRFDLRPAYAVLNPFFAGQGFGKP